MPEQSITRITTYELAETQEHIREPRERRTKNGISVRQTDSEIGRSPAPFWLSCIARREAEGYALDDGRYHFAVRIQDTTDEFVEDIDKEGGSLDFNNITLWSRARCWG